MSTFFFFGTFETLFRRKQYRRRTREKIANLLSSISGEVHFTIMYAVCAFQIVQTPLARSVHYRLYSAITLNRKNRTLLLYRYTFYQAQRMDDVNVA